MRFSHVCARVFVILATIFSLATTDASAQEGYPIGPGDALNVTFLSNPDLSRTVVVGVDGMVFLPLIGELSVQGETIATLRRQIPLLMTGAVFRERVGGEYLLVAVEPDDVLIGVEAYRPVYVDGVVATPGEQPFQVGLTLRQSIAAAGGLDLPTDAALTGADVRNHPRVLLADLVGVLAEIAVYEALLTESATLDLTDLRALDAPASLVNDAIALARRQVATADSILTDEIAFLNTSVEEAENRIIASLRHEEAVAAVVATEEAEVDRVANLVARRVISSEQLTQTRRLYLQAVDRLGDVQADRLEAETARRELVLERNQASRERALQTQDRLQDLSQQAAQLRVRIELSAAGPVVPDAAADPLRYVIFRQNGGQALEIEAAPETMLFPGDVVNVSFQYQ